MDTNFPNLRIFVFILLCAGLASCAGNDFADTSAPDAKDLSSSTTIHSTPTAYPGLVWAEGIAPTKVGAYVAEWSPHDNTLLLNTCPDLATQKAAIYRADAPDFVLRLLNENNVKCDLREQVSAWTPDGTHIVFTGRTNQETTSDDATLWIMDSDGKAPHPLGSSNLTAGRYPTILGWMDHSQLVYETYAGGGAHTGIIQDVFSGEVIVKAVMPGGFVAPHENYVAGSFFGPPEYAVALSREINGDHILTSYPGAEYLLAPPTERNDDEPFNASYYVDWLPNFSAMLIQRVKLDSEDDVWKYEVSRLALWNIPEQTLTTVAEGGINAHFSPTGDALVYVTLGDPWIDAEGHPIVADYRGIPRDESPYINVLDMETGVVTYSTETDNLDYLPTGGGWYDLKLGFSPDGRYLTLFRKDDSSQLELVLYDLKENAEIIKTAAQSFVPTWAPDSRRLVYRTAAGELRIIDTETQQSTLIASRGEEHLADADWSYDGRYLALYLRDNRTPRTAATFVLDTLQSQ